ncbi:MAG: transposase [Akkermansia sp.]|nr:transposase [Akkermansia sp.]MBQ9829224.1 transposase [Akkermansia sp.]
MSDKSRTRTPYSAEEKAQIVLAVLHHKTSIQKIAGEKNIAPTLVSLWKKQAEDAILDRFVSTRPGRRKVEATPDDIKDELRAARLEARTAKTRATRLETSLKASKARVAALEAGIRDLAAVMGCKLVKATRPRRKKA